MSVFSDLLSFVSYKALPAEQRELVIYSEGRNYWAHFRGLIEKLESETEIPIAYVSSSKDDPGIHRKGPRYSTFVIGKGSVRDVFFKQLTCKAILMTMPDLENYQIKRASDEVNYIYLQHSLNSLHMAYRTGAFDHFDTLFCAGPHHVKEARALEEQRKSKRKRLVEHGYPWLDELIEKAPISNDEKSLTKYPPSKIVLAPTWGAHSTIESRKADRIISSLLQQNIAVTLRPHPETIKSHASLVNELKKKYSSNSLFAFEGAVDGSRSFQESDIMISDWSGAAIEFAFAFGKPVLFADVPRKVNNPEYEEISLVPFEVEIREKIGYVLTEQDIDSNDWSSIWRHLHAKIDNTGLRSRAADFVFQYPQDTAISFLQELFP